MPSSPLDVDQALGPRLALPALALGGFTPVSAAPAETFRAALALARSLGFRAVMPDATVAGIRPRELDRSARRDLAAMLRRNELACVGLDLPIPAHHYLDPLKADRAIESLLAAIELAADLATLSSSGVVSRSVGTQAPVLCVSLPGALASDVRSLIESRADVHRVRVADLTAGEVAAGSARDGADGAPALSDPDSPIAVGLDVYSAWSRLAADRPAGSAAPNRILTGSAVFGSADASPADRLAGVISRLGARLAIARVSPVGAPSTGMDAGSIELVRFALLSIAGSAQAAGGGRTSSTVRVVIDPRHASDPASAARTELDRWG